jgi:hypothetical protein
MKLDPKATALAGGILWGLSVLLATLWIVIKGGGLTLMKLSQFYIGYSVSIPGAIIGGIYGFVHGFIFFLLFALIYNLFVKG